MYLKLVMTSSKLTRFAIPLGEAIVIWSYVGKSYSLHVIYLYLSHFLSTKSEDSHNVGELSNTEREICVIFLF